MDQMIASKILGTTPDKVAIHTMFLGGGFGRRANPTSDFVSEAVIVAKAAGVPVKVIWTRDDDIRGGYYRPAFVHRVQVGLDERGVPVAWDHVIVGQSILAGTPFAAFAIPTVVGELRRHFRDRGWMVRVPRRVQDLHLRIGSVVSELSQSIIGAVVDEHEIVDDGITRRFRFTKRSRL